MMKTNLDILQKRNPTAVMVAIYPSLVHPIINIT